MSDPAEQATLNQALAALSRALHGESSEKLPPALADHAGLQTLLEELADLQHFVLALGRGDLEPTLHLKGRLAGGLKALQANLRHLTWQTQQIAQGDLSQRVAFMGDFSTAFNDMVIALDETRAALLAREEQLRAEIAQREALITELEAQNAELDAFAHTVAHDLKNPLTALTGIATLLERHPERMPEDTRRANLQRIVMSSQRMANIIDELLLLASTHRQEQIPRQTIDMAWIVPSAVERLNDLIHQRQAQISLPETWPLVLGYAPWIEEVWVNYLSNAVKYGGDPPRIELGWESPAAGDTGAHTSHDQRPTAKFYVRDNGAGLTQEQQAQLFTEFTRLHQVRTQGHGLGLSIVLRIVTKLGGEVGVDSTPGQGSRFWFTLPAAPSPDT